MAYAIQEHFPKSVKRFSDEKCDQETNLARCFDAIETQDALENDFYNQVTLTRHAQKRIRQRGVSGHLLALVLAHADVETELGGGCVGLRVSKRLANRLDMRLSLGSNIDKVTNIIVVWSELTASIVTVLHPDNHGQNGRYLRAH